MAPMIGKLSIKPYFVNFARIHRNKVVTKVLFGGPRNMKVEAVKAAGIFVATGAAMVVFDQLSPLAGDPNAANAIKATLFPVGLYTNGLFFGLRAIFQRNRSLKGLNLLLNDEKKGQKIYSSMVEVLSGRTPEERDNVSAFVSDERKYPSLSDAIAKINEQLRDRQPEIEKLQADLKAQSEDAKKKDETIITLKKSEDENKDELRLLATPWRDLSPQDRVYVKDLKKRLGKGAQPPAVN